MIKLKKFTDTELGINLQRAISQFNEYIEAYGPNSVANGKYDDKLPDTMSDALYLARVLFNNTKDILSAGLLIRSRAANGAKIGGYEVPLLLTVLKSNKDHKNSSPLDWKDCSVSDANNALKSIEKATIDKYKKYLYL